MSGSPLGWREAGFVDRLGSEMIATQFFTVMYVPLWPNKCSLYLFRDAEGTEQYFEIPRDHRSVILGWLRGPVWFAAIILVAGGIGRQLWAPLVAGLVLALLGLYLTFLVGKLSPDERERRLLLHRVTGIGAPPELMSRAMREQRRDELAESWFHERGVSWRSAITDGVASEVLVAIAEYDRAPKLIIKARANLIDAEGN